MKNGDVVPVFNGIEKFDWNGLGQKSNGPSDYINRAIVFREERVRSSKDKDLNREKAFEILCSCCSMYLSLENARDPFKPIFAEPGYSSFIPIDLSSLEIKFLSDILDRVDDYPVRARIADLLWLRGEKEKIHFYAREAIKSYCQASFDEWSNGARVFWSRAIILAKCLGKGLVSRVKCNSMTLGV